MVCTAVCRGRLCAGCRAGLRPAPARVLSPAVIGLSAFLHEGPARLLVHRLKYQAILDAATVLAGGMVPLIPDDAAALVPVPRSLHRRLVHGVDPARELARQISRTTGLPMRSVLRAPAISTRHAGRTRDRRRPPSFEARSALAAGAVLIDDVVTTGSTLRAASERLGGSVRAAVTATAVPPMTSLTKGERGWSRSRLGLQMED